MHGAEKLTCKHPKRYNLSFHDTQLPQTDFDISLGMFGSEEEHDDTMNNPNKETTDDIRYLLIKFHKESQIKITETEETFQSSIVDLKIEIHQINSSCLPIIESTRAECKSYTENKCSQLRQELSSDLSVLSDRVKLIEGQDSGISALENLIREKSLSHII